MVKGPDINYVRTGERIRELRIEKRYSVLELAEQIGVHRTNLYHWEDGTNLPTIEHLIRLSWILGTGLDDIIVSE